MSATDRLGRWLSTRRIRSYAGPWAGLAVADVGCGYRADFARQEFEDADTVLLLDISLDPNLQSLAGARLIEGTLPWALADVAGQSLDVIVCNNVLEHVWEAELMVAELYRSLRDGGVLILNVPSWRGKWALELAAFKLGLAPEREMNDHKSYYDPRDLWPLLVKAGFRPSAIRCHRHKFGLNTIARCVKDHE